MSLSPPVSLAVVVAEKDLRHRCEVADYLAEHGVTAFVAGDIADLEILLAHERIDLVVADMSLPGGDGLSICRNLRRRRDLAIIVTSGGLTEAERIVALELGADDAMAKPYSLRELLARIRAVLRPPPPPPPPGPQDQLHFAGFAYRPTRRQLMSPKGEATVLAAAEARLLMTLLAHPHTLLSRETLIASEAPSSDVRAIDQKVSRLRRRLNVPGERSVILTRRGAGYLLDCDVVRRAS
ncbi:MAG: hypothetical protein BGN86_01680 [Caulobacterales bacterium 68-7]|nr:MAG: hypothetical protein BGN86_01680 [Caulobacterales bacterium 68-7]